MFIFVCVCYHFCDEMNLFVTVINELSLQQDSTSVTGGRSVAGLQDMHPAMPNMGQNTRRLETDFIDAHSNIRQ